MVNKKILSSYDRITRFLVRSNRDENGGKTLKYWQAFLIALTLMTKVRVPSCWFAEENARQAYSISPIFYPLVGGVLALILWCVSQLGLGNVPGFLLATIILITWVWVTGALHLDGLGDCTDAIFASHKNVNVLDVLKDSHVGSMAVVVIVLFLLFKCALIFSLVESHHHDGQALFWAFFFSATIARALTAYYMLITPYVSEGGLASGIALSDHKGTLNFSLFFIFGMALYVLPMLTFIALVFIVGLWLYIWRNFWIKTIDGYTGDCLGAFIEICEALSLFVLLVTWQS